jgi:hypothetical protein
VQSQEEAADLQTIRVVIAEELASALARQPQPVTAEPSLEEVNDAEAKYGARLDKMMNELTKPTS